MNIPTLRFESLVRFAGKLQFKYPCLSPLIRLAGKVVTGQGPGVIRYGEGAGLRFNASSVNPGFLMGTSEPLEQRLVMSFLKPNDVFYDVGANAGFYCVIAARKLGQGGIVYAFEPSPALVSRIRENADLNGFKNIEIVDQAISGESGWFDFNIEDELGVQNSLNVSDASKKVFRVRTVTIDEFVATHRPPDLILIDIEGAEIDALLGALKTIRQYLPVLMVEVHWLGDPFIEFVQTQLVPLGYVATTYEGATLPSGLLRYHCLLRVPGRHSSPY
jgi:FkbM family methyltransferase